MPHYTPLITTIVAALTLAWVFAAVAHRLKLPPLVGYLLAGIVIGPFTPGYVADQNLANQLAEIGVILLMFGVGLHFSLDDLLSVKKIAIPGAIAQIACATLLGMGLAAWLGWGVGAGLVFGLALSVASTVVLQGRDLVLAGAIISILLNPFLFSALDRLLHKREKAAAEAATAAAEAEMATGEPVRATSLTNHVVLVGHGRVGSVISRLLRERDVPFFVIEDDEDEVAGLTGQGIAALAGNAADPEVIKAANLRAARCLLVAIPDAFEGGQVVQQARAINPDLRIIARAHSEAEILHLMKHGASHVVMGEHEIAVAMASRVT
jgi:hypothetical protein